MVLGLMAAKWTGWLWLDAAVAIGVALNILVQGGQLVWQSSQGLMDKALSNSERERIDAVLQSFAQQPGLQFDNISTRSAGERSFVDLHMHVPGQWTVQRAAQLRADIEAALLKAVPGLYARIEMLPKGMETHSEVADLGAAEEIDKNAL